MRNTEGDFVIRREREKERRLDFLSSRGRARYFLMEAPLHGKHINANFLNVPELLFGREKGRKKRDWDDTMAEEKDG